jgi:hypothetical protein
MKLWSVFKPVSQLTTTVMVDDCLWSSARDPRAAGAYEGELIYVAKKDL